MTNDDLIHVARPDISGEALENITEVIASGQLTRGRFTQDLEEMWARYCETEYAIAVSNGTTALELALRGCGIGRGDRVVVPPLTFGATIEAVLHVDATPVFADINPLTYTLRLDSAEDTLRETGAKAILPVHLYGHPANMAALNEIAADHGARVIEDAAQAHGAEYGGEKAGGLGDVGCFSLYATKNVTAAEGGIITTDDPTIEDYARMARSHGMSDRDTHRILGYNYRMSELQAALACEQVNRIREINQERRRISQELLTIVDEEIEWASSAVVNPGVKHAYFWCPIEVQRKYDGKAMWRKLMDNGLETRHRYTKPLYHQPAFRTHSEVPFDCPIAEGKAGQVLGLPNHPQLTMDNIDQIRDILLSVRPE